MKRDRSNSMMLRAVRLLAQHPKGLTSQRMAARLGVDVLVLRPLLTLMRHRGALEAKRLGMCPYAGRRCRLWVLSDADRLVGKASTFKGLHTTEQAAIRRKRRELETIRKRLAKRKERARKRTA